MKTFQKYSAGGVIFHDGRVLTIRWISKDSIEFPKGKIESGEDAEDAAKREVLEETGYKTKILAPLGSVTFEFDWTDGKHYRKTVEYFLMDLVDDSEPKPNREPGEDFENLWLNPKEAMERLTFDDSKEILRRTIDLIESRLG